MTEGTITDLLWTKHSQDVFVPQCKDGPSTGAFCQMDAWAMKKSWSRPCVWGYEIKVSRSGFVGDNKWPGYLPYCNQFYFVAPKGIIQPDELPPEAGLLVVATTGTRLFTKKKAPHRDVEIPESLYRYLLMWRTKICRERPQGNQLSYWRSWLAEKEERRDIGHRVSRALSAKYRRDVTEVQCRQRELASRIEKLEALEKAAKDLGINLHGWDIEGALARQVKRAKQPFPSRVIRRLEEARTAIGDLLGETDE